MKVNYLSERIYHHYESMEDGVYIYTEGMETLFCQVCNAFTFRVWADKTGRFQKRSSFAVVKEKWDFKEYFVEDSPESLSIHTEILTLEIKKNGMELVYKRRSNGQILLQGYQGQQTGFGEDGSICGYYELDSAEHIYGLGEDNDAYTGCLDRRGSNRDLVTGQTINKGCVTADIPIPFFLSTGREGEGYGFFVDNTYHMEMDMGKENEECFFWKAQGGEAVTYFLYGPELKKVVERYTHLTGRPEMLPLWTLGMLQCKCSYQDWDEVDDVVETLLEKGFPVDAVIFDYDWPQHMHNFKWHPRWKGLSASKIKDYRKKGIHFMVSNTGPMIKKDSSNFQDALDNGVMALDAEGNTLTCGHYGGELMDFTAPDMKEWIKKQITPLMDDGVEGWWLDLTEPEGEPVQTLYKGGSKEEIHNVYSYLCSKAYYDSHREYMPHTRPFILTRTGTPGIQRLSSSIWSGDVYSDYVTFSAHCPEALNSGMSGIPYWTSDIGGFISSTYESGNPLNVQLYQNDAAAHGLLYERWFQFGCFCPIMRVHHAGPSEPYRFGGLIEAGCRHYINLRYKLLPYIYSYMWETHKTGLSIMRSLVLEYQKDKNVYGIKDEFLFGDVILVAPVLTENTTKREVYFPEGKWVDWDYGYEYEGGETYTVYAPQNRIPLFVKRGAILPMVKERKSTYEKPWDPVVLHMYPRGCSSFIMYQDDGITTEYKTKGIYTETTFSCEEYDDRAILRIDRTNRYFVPAFYETIWHTDKVVKDAVCGERSMPVWETAAAYKKASEGVYVDNLEKLCYVKFASDTGMEQTMEVIYAKKCWERSVPCKDMRLEDKQMPYFLPPATVPCKIQAENFDRGGEGIAYHVVQGENPEGVYRQDAVHIEVCNDEGGGYDVFDLKETEWLEYTINVTKNLTAKNLYHILLRVSCDTPDTKIHISVDNDNKSGSVEIPLTGGRDRWATVEVPEKVMHDGEHILQFYVESGKVSLNYMEIVIS